ncbi:unnamed protein product [Phytomonas sp. Hart1]|nr:unnamed protein product [Phytomonas sp. Hart1]|eukprot:CCW67488.1 unnamed protein product [Phytomonas sp. isolate Hart1]
MHCNQDIEAPTHENLMCLEEFRRTICQIYFEFVGYDELMANSSLQTEMEALVEANKTFLQFESPRCIYPLCLSVSSTRLQHLVHDNYPNEYKLYVDNNYNRRWEKFAVESNFVAFNYEPVLLEAEPALACYLNSSDQRFYLVMENLIENVEMNSIQYAFYVRLSDTALGINLMHQLNSPLCIALNIRVVFRKLVFEIQQNIRSSIHQLQSTIPNLFSLLQDTQCNGMPPLVVIAKEVATLLKNNNVTLRSMSHNQLTSITNSVLIWMATHKPEWIPITIDHTVTEATREATEEGQFCII